MLALGSLILLMLSAVVYIRLLYDYWIAKNLQTFGYLPPFTAKYAGFLAIPTLVLFLPHILQVEVSDGREGSLVSLANDTFLRPYIFAVLVVSGFAIGIVWYCKRKLDAGVPLPLHPDAPIPIPPGMLNPLEATARFYAQLEMPKVLADKIGLAHFQYLVDSGTKYFDPALMMRQGRAVNYLMTLIPARSLLTDGDITLHELLHPSIKDAVSDDTHHGNLMQVLELGDFKDRFYNITVGYALPEGLRNEHHQIVAGTGHGKTQCIQSMVLDDMKRGAGVVVIDSQGDLINNLLAHLPLDKVILIDPETCPPALNIFKTAANTEMEIATAIELYEYIFSALEVGMTGKQTMVYRYLSRLLMTVPDATIETMRDMLLPGGTEPYQAYIDALGPNARTFFAEFQKEKGNQYGETRQEILRRVLTVLESDTFSKMLGSRSMKVDMDAWLDDGKVVLVNTSKRLLKSGYGLFGRIFIALVMQSVMSRPQGKRKRSYCYIDEFGDYADDSEVLLNLFTQTRKYELGMVVCHQFLGQLTEKLRKAISTNTAIKFAGGVSPEDAEALARQFQLRPDMLINMPKFHFLAAVKGVGTVSWLVQPGRLESLPKHSDAELEQFRMKMRTEIGADAPPDRVKVEPETEIEEDRW